MPSIDGFGKDRPSHLEEPSRRKTMHRILSIMKRAMDLFVSVTALILLLPLIGVAAFLIRVTMGAPVLFRQVRPGLKERPFTLLKFRTMRAEQDGNGRALPDQARLTKLGRWLRKHSIDELPQLYNVVRNDMSLVGPRPLLTDYLALYSAEQRRRHDVKPGITGWAQVNGRNQLSWERKFDLDLWYVDHWTLWVDIRVLCLTFLKVIRQEGISPVGLATMPEFTGSASRDPHAQ